MPGFVDELEQAVLNHVFDKATYTPPAAWWLGVSTTTPDDAGGSFTEPGGSYARVETAPADWASASGTAPAQVVNAVAIAFAAADTDWTDVTAAGLFEAATLGSPKMVMVFNTAQTVATGQTLEFAAGTLKMQLGDVVDTFA